METFRAPYTYRNCDPSLKLVLACNSNHLQNLARPKVIVNDWLTVTNRVPPVNDAQGHCQLPKADSLRSKGHFGGFLWHVRAGICRVWHDNCVPRFLLAAVGPDITVEACLIFAAGEDARRTAAGPAALPCEGRYSKVRRAAARKSADCPDPPPGDFLRPKGPAWLEPRSLHRHWRRLRGAAPAAGTRIAGHD